MGRYRFAKDAGGAMYVFKEGIYRRGAEELIRADIIEILALWRKEKSWKASLGTEVARYIADNRTPLLCDLLKARVLPWDPS